MRLTYSKAVCWQELFSAFSAVLGQPFDVSQDALRQIGERYCNRRKDTGKDATRDNVDIVPENQPDAQQHDERYRKRRGDHFPFRHDILHYGCFRL
jgi:hypothetical protein